MPELDILEDSAVACEFCGHDALSLERAPGPCIRCNEMSCTACMVRAHDQLVCLDCLAGVTK